MRFYLYAAVTTLFAFFAVFPAFAADMEGSADHSRVPRLPGYEIVDYVAGDFGAHDFYASEEDVQTVEGKIWRIDYQIAEGVKPKAALEVARNYETAFKSKGGDVYEEGVDISGGRSYAWMTEENGAQTWMEIEVSNHGEYYVLTLVETAPLEQAIEIGTDEVVKALQEQGSIALYGILFDTGKSEIRTESEETIVMIVQALTAVPEMRIEVSGHTDNVGGKEYNQKLSTARAEAVKSALLARGIEEARLESAGYGYTKPVAPNDTDEGRAKNRRVELTKLSE